MTVEATPVLAAKQVASLLGANLTAIEAELSALPEALLAWHPAEGEWCVKETLGHIVEAERRGFAGRIRQILEQDEPALPGWDQQAVARERQDCARPGPDVLAEFRSLRGESIRLVEGLSDAQLGRGGTHERVGYLRVNDLLHEWVHHDRNHTRQILANVQSAVWPHMGNAQRFVGE